MVRAGAVIENPVTGERIVFHETSRETHGEAVVFETFVRLPFPPAFVQRLGLALGAPLGRLLGYAPTYAATGEPLAANA